MSGADPQSLARMLSQQPLAGGQEERYRLWALMNNVPQSDDYDMRGFYSALMSGDPAAGAAVNPNDGQMHFPDQWKRPSHPSFSTDSMYARASGISNVPSWVGGDLPNGGASWSLRKPNGAPVVQEAPWFAGGIKQ